MAGRNPVPGIVVDDPYSQAFQALQTALVDLDGDGRPDVAVPVQGGSDRGRMRAAAAESVNRYDPSVPRPSALDVGLTFAGGPIASAGGKALSTLAKAGPTVMSALGILGSSSETGDAAAPQGGAGVATQGELENALVKQKAPGYDPLRDMKTEMETARRRIDTNTKKIVRINSTNMPGNAATANEGRQRSIKPLQDQIDQDQNRIKFLEAEYLKTDKATAPLREKYGTAATVATVAAPVLAGLAARYGLGKNATKVNALLDDVAGREAALDSVGTVRGAQALRTELGRLGPKDAATMALAATIPADLQGMSDVIDYKAAPRWSRAYQEAAKNYEDPGNYLMSLFPAFLSGVAGVGVGSKFAPQAKVGEARSYVNTLENLDQRPYLERYFGRQQSPEQLAQVLAGRQTNALTADLGVINATAQKEEAMRALAAARAQPAQIAVQPGAGGQSPALPSPQQTPTVGQIPQGQPPAQPVQPPVQPVLPNAPNPVAKQPPARPVAYTDDMRQIARQYVEDQLRAGRAIDDIDPSEIMAALQAGISGKLPSPSNIHDRTVATQDLLRYLQNAGQPVTTAGMPLKIGKGATLAIPGLIAGGNALLPAPDDTGNALLPY